MSLRRSAKAISTALLLLLGASVAEACPVCMLADPKTASTYLGMTLMMSALPLGMIGGLIYWLKRRYSSPLRTRAVSNTDARVPELIAAHRNI